MVLVLAAGSVRASAQDGAPGLRGLEPFLERFCLDCHGGDDPEAGLALDALDLKLGADFGRWVEVHDKLRAGKMPPEDWEQPRAEERDAVLKELAAGLEAVGAARRAEHGRVRLRRLNRKEYENTLRDLLALPHLDVKSMLPADGRSHGFDKVGAALNLSYVQMGRYLEAANAAFDAAMELRPRPSKKSWHDTLASGFKMVARRIEQKREAALAGDHAAFLRQPKPGQPAWTWTKFEPPVEGRYRIKLKSSAIIWDRGKTRPGDREHVIIVYAKKAHEKRWLATIDVDREPDVAEISAWMKPGELLELYLPTLSLKITRPESYSGPAIVVEWLDAEGPLIEEWPPQSHRCLFGDLPVAEWTPESGLLKPPPRMRVIGSDRKASVVPDLDSPRRMVLSADPKADAKRLLYDFMRRAFRRPVAEDEVDHYLPLVADKLSGKHCFQEAMRIGYQAVLCSPDFLFFRESPGRLDDHALAARMSYFLWNSMPDDELLGLAAKGRLREPEVTRAQVERMLDDERSKQLVEDFLAQWLELEDITITQPDDRLYPEFDRHLLESMVRESQAYFTEMLRRDLGARYVVESDFLTINGRLARHYGIPGVGGVKIRRVELPAASPRGGFLTQASVLKVTANGTTTSPVIRGAWVLDHVLGTPSPLPPPNVPAIEPDLRGQTTVRQQLAKHRSDPSCASCHAKIDPPGFALESFDVIGGWRERYRSYEGKRGHAKLRDGTRVKYRIGPAVDASGVAPDGRPFSSIAEFREILLADEEQLARNLVEQLLTYATGAGIGFADRRQVEEILKRSRKSGFGVRTLIHEIVQSETFRCK